MFYSFLSQQNNHKRFFGNDFSLSISNKNSPYLSKYWRGKTPPYLAFYLSGFSGEKVAGIAFDCCCIWHNGEKIISFFLPKYFDVACVNKLASSVYAIVISEIWNYHSLTDWLTLTGVRARRILKKKSETYFWNLDWRLIESIFAVCWVAWR